MLVLFLLSDANYYTVYFLISLADTIVKLNVILLLCITIASTACANCFIHCVIQFNLVIFSSFP